MLTVGIDAKAAVEEPAGRGRMVRDLVTELDRRGDDDVRYVLYVREPWEVELGPRFEQRAIAGPDGPWHLRVARAANAACDVFLSTNSYLTLWFLRVPAAVFVHDLIAFLEHAAPQRRAALIEKATIRPALRRARALVCNSESTRRDLVERFPGVADRASVVHLAGGRAFAEPVSEARRAETLARLGLDVPFVLSTGTLEPRKNIVRLIEAWTGLAPEVRDGRVLALTGRQGWQFEEVLRSARASVDEVRVLGFVEDADLVALYASCEAFAFPSLYEGFGLPVHEAMLAGAPVVTSAVSSLPEVGGEAAIYVDPLDVGSIRGGLERVLTDPAERERLRREGPRQAAGFSAERTAEGMLAVLRRVASA